MVYLILANSVLALHLLYAGYLVFGLVAILVGSRRKWKWVRNPWFRLTHLCIVAVAPFEVVCGLDCPLSVWEMDLRQAAGHPLSPNSFISLYAHGLLSYHLSTSTFRLIHMGLGWLAVILFITVPPRPISFRKIPDPMLP